MERLSVRFSLLNHIAVKYDVRVVTLCGWIRPLREIVKEKPFELTDINCASCRELWEDNLTPERNEV